jgi:hypothetical protein
MLHHIIIFFNILKSIKSLPKGCLYGLLSLHLTIRLDNNP